MISLKQIRYALAVGQTLHFKKAAEACNVSQSALSTAISELEKQLGVAIFERNNKQVLVTKEGEIFLTKAQNIKRELDDLVQLSQLNKAPLSTDMSMGVIPTIGPYLLPKVLPDVRQTYPEFRLKIVEDQSHILVDMVRRGEIDVAVLALPYATDGLLTLPFWQEDFYWVSHKDECPSQMNEITSSEMALDKLMLLKDGHCLKEHALEACQLQSFKQRDDFQSASLHTLIQMVAGKLGTTLVPEMALEQLITPQSELKAVHLNEPGPHRRLAFIVRPNFVKMDDVTELVRLFKSSLTTTSNGS